MVPCTPPLPLSTNFQSPSLTPPKPEFAHPYAILESNCDIVVASPAGGAAPLDPTSVDATKDDVQSQSFLATKEALWKNTAKLEGFLGRAAEFEALFFIGGHGRAYLPLPAPAPLFIRSWHAH
jgi:putative intracellular protease/amidase